MNKNKNSINKENKWNHAFADFIVTLGILLSASVVCYTMHEAKISGGTNAATMIFVLAVFVISLVTNSYMWGIISSFSGVVIVNYIFTYPYYKLNFEIAGYPITFLTMLIVSVITSFIATQAKQKEILKNENEKERIRGNLLRSISHDLRTPLTSIVGSTSALLNDAAIMTDVQKRQLLQDVHDDGEWLINAAENILSITRVGNENNIKKKLELAEELIETAVRKFEKRHPDSIPVEVFLPEHPILVPMDMILMEQVITNILENAINHGRGLTYIKVAINYDNDFAYISIENDGECVPSEKIATLFDSTLTQDNNVKSINGKRCLGIGLAVCSTIVNAHGGNIAVKNTGKNTGVRFTISLPIEKGVFDEN